MEESGRIQKFRGDGTYGTQWGRKGSFPGQFDNPAGIAVDAAGNVYGADMSNDRIQTFAPLRPE